MTRYKKIFSEARLYICNYLIAYMPSHTIRQFYYKRIMGFELGKNCSILLGTQFTCKGNLSMGENSVINQSCLIDNRGGIRIADNVSISRGTYILTADHDVQSKKFEGRELPVQLASKVFIGSRAMILPGLRIAEGAVVAAASVVTKDVRAYEIVAGSPAKKIKDRNTDLDYTTIYRRLMQ